MSVVIAAGNHGVTPNITDSYNLTCYVAGGNISGITYQWRKKFNKDFYRTGTTVQFDALQLSDVGEYICDALHKIKNYSTSQSLIVKSKLSIR